MPTATEYINLYEQGMYTRAEIVSLFVTWAGERLPEDIISELPAEFVSGVRKLVANPPSSISEVFTIKCDQAYEEAWFKGAWRWHRYFSSARSDV